MKLRYALAAALLSIPLALGTYNALAQCPGINCVFNQVIAIPVDGIRTTYAISVRGLVPATNASDIVEFCGSATKTVRITKISVGGRATSAASVDLTLVKRSTANSGGTATNPTRVPYDASAGAASATVSAYTANPTLGTAVGSISTKQLFLGNLTTGAPGADAQWTFGDRPATAVILRAAAQCLGISFNSGTASGGLLDAELEWTEE